MITSIRQIHLLFSSQPAQPCHAPGWPDDLALWATPALLRPPLTACLPLPQGNGLQLGSDAIILSKAVDARFPLFFCLHQGALLLSDRWQRLQQQTRWREWDLSHLAYFLCRDETQLRQSPLRGILQLFNGETLRLDRRSGQMHSSMQAALDCLMPQEAATNLPQLLQDSLVRQLGQQEALLEFSGGLDSTALLLSARAAGIRLHTVTAWDSQASAPDDRRHAQQCAVRQGVPHALIDLAQLDAMQLDAPLPAHYPSHMFLAQGYEQRLLACAAHHGQRIHLNGHGGDHLFLASPPLACVLEAPPAQRADTLRRLAAYYGLPLLALRLKLARLQLQHLLGGPRIRDEAVAHTTWLDPALPRLANRAESWHQQPGMRALTPVQHWRASLLYQLAQEVSHPRLRDGQTGLLFPFFDRAIMCAAHALPAWQGFDARRSRLVLRRALYQRYHEPAVWRVGKGHTTAMVLRALNRHHDTLAGLIREGYLLRQGLLSWPALERDLQRQRHGIGGVTPLLMKIIAIEYFLHHAAREMA